MDVVRRIADAVLYEGYVLWPYRRSATKNQKRWTFGGVFPPAHTAEHPDDRSEVLTETLLERADDDAIEVRVRFLHIVDRRIGRRTPDGLELVSELEVDGERHLAWEEAVEREVGLVASVDELLSTPARLAIDIPGGEEEEALGEAGAIVRVWEPLQGAIDVQATALAGGIVRVTVRIANETVFAGPAREDALRRSFCSTHAVLHDDGAGFVSLTDPVPAAGGAVKSCRNEGLWPALVGEEGDRSTVLAAPIILSDYPQIAPESPGDLFDATEIDELLTLNTLALTDEEKAEVRASDPRTREILERSAALSPEQLARLHGAVRDLRPADRS